LPARKRTPGSAGIGDAIDDYLKRHGLTKRLEQASVVHEWPELVGQQLAEVSRPDGVDATGTLWVRVKSAAWVQELQMMSPMIIRDLARKGKRLKRIRWIAADW
jgi:predicted nucleic acid-binding Zn ribbon protein